MGGDDQDVDGLMLFWWCALGVVLAVVYMVSYTLLRTSADRRPWYRRLRHPKGPRREPDDVEARSDR